MIAFIATKAGAAISLSSALPKVEADDAMTYALLSSEHLVNSSACILVGSHHICQYCGKRGRR